FIRLRDGSGNLLPVDKAANGAAPSFTFTPATNGTYLLAVSADGAGDTWKAKTGDFQAKFTDVGTASTYSFDATNKVVGESDGNGSGHDLDHAGLESRGDADLWPDRNEDTQRLAQQRDCDDVIYDH